MNFRTAELHSDFMTDLNYIARLYVKKKTHKNKTTTTKMTTNF